MLRQTLKIVIFSKDSPTLHEMSRAAAPVYEVLATADSRTADGWIAGNPGVTVVASDALPLLETARRLLPSARRVLVTDYQNLGEIVCGLHDETIHHLVNKPLQQREFLAAIAPMPGAKQEAEEPKPKKASAI
jgi:hypothetical protein